ncbi:MAG: efflux RND transporter periplasmic adaptor subunit [bacterium]
MELNLSKFILFNTQEHDMPMMQKSKLFRMLSCAICIFLLSQNMTNISAQDVSISNNLKNAIRVRTVKPVLKPEMRLSIEQPADVSSYYRAELYSEVAGKVIFLEKDLGDTVISGEKIVEIQPSPGQQSNQNSGVITAPFDGVIASRTIDPGSFVPSAAIVPGARPIVTIERNDIVTISMKVPDQYSSLIDQNTSAEIRMDPLPGQVLKSKITRIAPSLSMGDRTLTVQVDLFNGTAADYEKLKSKFEKNGGADLKSRRLPEYPKGASTRKSAGLIPGMYGKMKLEFNSPADRLYLPASAIQRMGGVEYLYRVENGLARKLIVKTVFDNGTFVSVTLSGNDQNNTFLNQTDDIIISNLSELDEAQPVASFSDEAQNMTK